MKMPIFLGLLLICGCVHTPVFEGPPGCERLFEQPTTGVRYALALEEWRDRGPDGTSVAKGGRKLLVSSTPAKWMDITPFGRHLANAFCIFPDPDHPNRICVLDQNPNLVVLQTSLDDHSIWQSYSGEEWAQHHAGWNWTGFFAELETRGPIAASEHNRPGNDWRDRLRRKCHAQIARRGSHPHDAFLRIVEAGNKSSVPLLIAAIRWQVPPVEHKGQKAMVCTTAHCTEALEALTGESFGFDPDRWEEWWNKKGKSLPEEQFKPKAVKKRSEAPH